MTEVAHYNPQAIADYQTAAVQRLGAWAQSAQAAHQVAQALVGTSFVPASFRGKADEATAAILAGVEVGLSPMNALRAFDVIQGQAAPRAITLRAIVQSYGHEVEVVESTSTRCRMRGRRKGASNWQSVTWTMDRARELGLTGKDNWKKQPAAMLVARATSEVCRLIAADAILGIGYSSEEVADGGTDDAPPVVTSEPEPTTRRMSYTPPPADDLEPPPLAANEPIPTDEQIQPGAVEGESLITSSQSKMLHALLNENEMGDRATGLAYIAHVVGHDVETSKALTKAEASRVIDSLKPQAES